MAVIDYIDTKENDQSIDLGLKTSEINKLSERIERLEIDKNALSGEVQQLRNGLDECLDRILTLEKYSSKDSIIFSNPPITANMTVDQMRDEMVQFINHTFAVNFTMATFVHCHPLGNFSKNQHAPPPAVIVKFV